MQLGIWEYLCLCICFHLEFEFHEGKMLLYFSSYLQCLLDCQPPNSWVIRGYRLGRWVTEEIGCLHCQEWCHDMIEKFIITEFHSVRGQKLFGWLIWQMRPLRLQCPPGQQQARYSSSPWDFLGRYSLGGDKLRGKIRGDGNINFVTMYPTPCPLLSHHSQPRGDFPMQIPRNGASSQPSLGFNTPFLRQQSIVERTWTSNKGVWGLNSDFCTALGRLLFPLGWVFSPGKWRKWCPPHGFVLFCF